MSDEVIGLCSRAQNCKIVDCEDLKNESFLRKPIVEVNEDTASNCSQSLQESGFTGFSCDATTYTPENSLLYVSDIFEDQSFNYKKSVSDNKLKELKQAISEANDEFLSWKISELMVSSCRTSTNQMTPQLADKVKEIILSSSLANSMFVKSRRGEVLNIIHLEKNVIDNISKKSLSFLEKTELIKRASSALEAQTLKMISEKAVLKGVFGSHCLKVNPPSTVLWEEQAQMAELCENVRQQLFDTSQLIVSCGETALQLTHLQSDSALELDRAMHTSVKQKATHLCITASILKQKMDQILFIDAEEIRATNALGKTLKDSVNNLQEECRSLQKMLEKYEKKESSSKSYCEIVREFAKTKRQLHHKLQTLKVLNDPDVSFS